MKKSATSIYDFLGISSASVCLIHCLIFPFFTVLPFGLEHSPFIDLAFALIGVFAIIKIIKKTNKIISSILIISIALIWMSILSEIFLDVHLHLMFVGGIGMMIGHFLNYKSHKKQHDDTTRF